MAGNFSVYNIGGDGVNLVKDPLELGDQEAVRLQNAEFVPNAGQGGKGALSKRGGLAALNAALSGAVTGMIGLNLKTTYTRTMYAARGTATANTWRKSTDGTTWADTASPSLAHAKIADFADANGLRDLRRVASVRNLIAYPGDVYTVGTNNPPLVIWDGTEGFTVTAIPVGPSATALTPAYAIVDSIVVKGKLYMAIHDPGGAAPALAGRVVSLDLQSGKLTQIAAAFGSGTGEQGGGYPCCLCWYQEQLFVGLQGSNTTDAIGTVVRCRPDLDTTWTSDVATLSGYPCSLVVFRGDLLVGTQSSVATAEKIYRRAATTKAYVASFTGVGAGAAAYCTSGIVYGTSVYFVQYHNTAPTIHVKVSTDGITFTTDRDVDATDGAVAGNTPAGAVVFGTVASLYIVFRATTTTATDGFTMQNTAGVWTKVDVARNLSGPLVTLVERS